MTEIGPGQIFKHIENDGTERHFSILFLEEHRKRHPDMWELCTLPIDRQTARHFIRTRDVDPTFARSISLTRADEPGIACIMPIGTVLLVDGHHRFVKRALFLDRRDIQAWVCGEEVWSLSLVRTVDGTVIIPYPGGELP